MRSRRRHAIQAIGAAEKLQVFHHGEITVKREFLRHIADLAAGRRRRMPQVDSGNLKRTAGGEAEGRKACERWWFCLRRSAPATQKFLHAAPKTKHDPRRVKSPNLRTRSRTSMTISSESFSAFFASRRFFLIGRRRCRDYPAKGHRAPYEGAQQYHKPVFQARFDRCDGQYRSSNMSSCRGILPGGG